METITRFDKLRAFMVIRRMIWQDVADVLCISTTGCRMACQRDRINKEHHKKLLEFGFPEHLLPPPTRREYRKAHTLQLPQAAI